MLDYSDLVSNPDDYVEGPPPVFAITITVADFESSIRRDPEQCFMARVLKKLPRVEGVIVAPSKVRILWFGHWWSAKLSRDIRNILRQWDSDEVMTFTNLETTVGPWIPHGTRKSIRIEDKKKLGAIVSNPHKLPVGHNQGRNATGDMAFEGRAHCD